MTRKYESACLEISGSVRHTPACAPAQWRSPWSPRGIPIHRALLTQLVLAWPLFPAFSCHFPSFQLRDVQLPATMLVSVFAKQFMSYLEPILDVVNLCKIWFENALLFEHSSHSVLHGSPFFAHFQER